MTRAELLALADRAEWAEGADRELDAEIAVAVYGGEIVWKTANYIMDPYPARRYPSAAHVGGYCNGHIPAFTTSLDAALSLVPEGWGWQMRRSHHGKRAVCYLWNGCGVWSPTVVAATPALALVAAALRARAAEGEG